MTLAETAPTMLPANSRSAWSLRRGLRAVSAIAVMGLMISGCSQSPGDSEAPEDPQSQGRVVVTDIYPTTYAVSQVIAGQDAGALPVEIVQLVPEGVDPHSFELSAAQVAQIADADLVLYVPGLIPAVADAIEQEAAERSVDITAGIPRRVGDSADGDHPAGTSEPGLDATAHSSGDDTHVWLYPRNMASMGANAAAAMADLGMSVSTDGFNEEMSTLDGELQSALGLCTIDTMVVSHEAFGYLADAYGFIQVGVAGLSPDAEPSPARLAEITDLVRDRGITTIYFESLASPETAETIAAETGAATALLDPLEGNTGGQGYPAIMRANKDTLHKGQSCS